MYKMKTNKSLTSLQIANISKKHIDKARVSLKADEQRQKKTDKTKNSKLQSEIREKYASNSSKQLLLCSFKERKLRKNVSKQSTCIKASKNQRNSAKDSCKPKCHRQKLCSNLVHRQNKENLLNRPNKILQRNQSKSYLFKRQFSSHINTNSKKSVHQFDMHKQKISRIAQQLDALLQKNSANVINPKNLYQKQLQIHDFQNPRNQKHFCYQAYQTIELITPALRLETPFNLRQQEYFSVESEPNELFEKLKSLLDQKQQEIDAKFVDSPVIYRQKNDILEEAVPVQLISSKTSYSPQYFMVKDVKMPKLNIKSSIGEFKIHQLSSSEYSSSDDQSDKEQIEHNHIVFMHSKPRPQIDFDIKEPICRILEELFLERQSQTLVDQEIESYLQLVAFQYGEKEVNNSPEFIIQCLDYLLKCNSQQKIQAALKRAIFCDPVQKIKQIRISGYGQL